MNSSLREEFGAVVLTLKDGVGCVSVPRHVDAQALTNLRLALLAALGRCSSMVVNWSHVARCDLFFFQLLCAAQHTYQAQGIELGVEGLLDDSLMQAAQAMGFGCNSTPASLFGAA